MANQPTKYRKFLAGAATASLVATAVAPTALAASFPDVNDNNSHKEHIDALFAAGIIGGYQDGTFGPNNTLTRSHVVKMMGKWLVTLGYEVPADYKTVQRFDDVSLNTNDQELLQYSALVKDHGVFVGNEGKLNPAGNITRENMAIVLVRAFDSVNKTDLVKYVSEQTFTGDVTDKAAAKAEARPYIDVLDYFDITNPASKEFNPKNTVTRAQFASFLNKTINTKVEAGEVSIASFKAVGAKKLEVTFNKAVDTSKAGVKVAKGSVATNTDGFVWSDDKKTLTITTTTNLTKGEYKVTISGLADADLTSTVTVDDQKISAINITTTTAPMNDASKTIDGVNYATGQTAFVRYEVVNQYGEAMRNVSGINWSQSTGGKIDSSKDGQLILGNTANAGVAFIPGNKVFITGVHAASGTVVNGEVTIGLASKADKVEFAGVYNTSTKKIENLPAGFENGKHVLLFDVKDQYGNLIEEPNLNDLSFTSTNPLFVATPTSGDTTTVEYGDDVYQGLRLVRGSAADKGGTATIQVISKLTGTNSSYVVSSEAKSTLKTFTLSAPDKIVAEGETVEIPYTAVDQFGNAVNRYADLNGKVTFSDSNLKLVQKPDGTAKLEYTASLDTATPTMDAPVYLTSIVPDGGNYSSLMLSVKDRAVPTTIVGLDNTVSTALAKGSSETIKPSELVVQDQYGRTVTDANFEKWLDDSANSVVISSVIGATSPFAVSLNPSTVDSATVTLANKDAVATVASKSGSNLSSTERLVFSLAKDGAAIDSSAKSFTFRLATQSSFVSYEVADLGTMYVDTTTTDSVSTAHNVAVEVYGVEQDGTKVLLPASQFTVATTSKLAVNGDEISDRTGAGQYVASDFVSAGAYTDVKVNVLVTVNDGETGAAASIIEKELVLSNKAPKVDVINVNTTKVSEGKAFVSASSTGDIANVELDGFINASKLYDQYGVVISEDPTITITNLVKASDSSFTVVGNGSQNTRITGAKAGDKFTATYKYASGKSVSIEFTVSAN